MLLLVESLPHQQNPCIQIDHDPPLRIPVDSTLAIL